MERCSVLLAREKRQRIETWHPGQNREGAEETSLVSPTLSCVNTCGQPFACPQSAVTWGDRTPSVCLSRGRVGLRVPDSPLQLLGRLDEFLPGSSEDPELPAVGKCCACRQHRDPRDLETLARGRFGELCPHGSLRGTGEVSLVTECLPRGCRRVFWPSPGSGSALR